jgi:hypothetical protein
MVDILDGAANADPGSCLTPGPRPASERIEPDSGVEGTCGTVPDGEDGRGDARGGEDDRNVELVVRDPR